jgi:hypothetical protein
MLVAALFFAGIVLKPRVARRFEPGSISHLTVLFYLFQMGLTPKTTNPG